MNVVKVKVCGITNESDAIDAISFGADALGFIFFSKSPRCICSEKAAKISQNIPPFIGKVGLFVNQKREEIFKCIDKVGLNVLQFHGDESQDFCDSFKVPWIKTIPVDDKVDINERISRYDKASAILFDRLDQNARGGTGRSFDWNLLPSSLSMPFIVAGGLKPDNVGGLLNTVVPYAVDVCSGVEKEKGRKDKQKLRQFIEEVKER